MFGIGDLARHGRVSARMLRHYDAIALLRPRRAQLQSQIATDTTRLAQVEARLQIIEREGAMPANEVQVKRVPGVRVAELTGTAAAGYNRQLYIECGEDRDTWVTELQEPIATS